MRKDFIFKAAQIIRNGGVVVYPTDTAYGMAVDASNLEAVRRLYEVKGRNYNKATHVIFPSFVELNRTVKLTPAAKKLIQNFFPGPLTVVTDLKKKSGPWKILSAGTGTLGFRMPDSPIVRELIKILDRPITTTSANVSGRAPGYSVPQIKKQFQKSRLKPDYYLNGGKLKRVKPSTVVQIRDSQVRLLREGPVPFEEIKQTIK